MIEMNHRIYYTLASGLMSVDTGGLDTRSEERRVGKGCCRR